MVITQPLVSVIMAVKNGGEIVREAVDSILNQTLVNFEFIIIDDGSTDNTLDVLGEYRDPRIQIFSQENQGLARSLNRGICLSTGKYLARQDHDDISFINRLEQQVAYMESHPECGLLGTAANIWEGERPSLREHNHPIDPEILKFELIFNNPFVHTSWFFRSDVIKRVGYYTIDPDREPPEDYEYVSRISRQFDVANLSEILVIYREVSGSLSSEIRPNSDGKQKSFISKLALISSENIAFWNGIPFTNAHARNFGALLHGDESKYVGGSSFRELKNLLFGAARNIPKFTESMEYKHLMELKINSLRYQYLVSKKVKYYEKLLVLFSISDFIFILRLLSNRATQKIYNRIFGPGPRREKALKLLKQLISTKHR